MSGCTRFDAALSAFRDGELDARESAALEAHLAACEPCRRTLAGFERLELELRALPRPTPSPDFERRFWARVGAADPRRADAQLPPPGLAARLRALAQRLGARRGDGDAEGRRFDWLAPALATAAVSLALWLVLPGAETDPIDPDWLLAADDAGFELVLAADLELLDALEILEAWDGPEES